MQNSWRRSSGWRVVALFVLSALVWTGCTSNYDTPVDPQASQQVVTLGKDNPQIQAVMAVQDRHTPSLMAIPGVVGTATGLTDDGRPAILVFTKTDIMTPALAKGRVAPLPESIEGVPVVVEVTGEFRAMKSGGGGVSHTAKQTPPIQLGTSGGWRYDLANGYCCGGTLGSLIQKGGTQYILSNYHVLYADIVSGGNSRTAQPGDPVIQPGLIDVSCNANNAQNVATLVSNGGTLPGANIDAGIAAVISGMVRTDGAILEIGTLSANTVAAALNQAVKKSGRTTGLTRSTVSGLNATVSVTYDNECAGGTAFTKTFTGQIVVKNRRSSFLNSGDSGSLMVEDVSTKPRAIGLLYAGSSTSAIANPINEVLSYYGATMVGN
ncbi:MAG: S1 family peptidase [candidate division KSB1 bacterium]|nr:S1 family peptidase [candidate division KSB1 bacterium]MDZ7273871.1 S1 family peptidase [candidate division KSB1 bacterium]MDZ7286027.1 S1 family peptidase [candidate division KSB1 bacterium]MDZ7299059.1 S1 family peptidase [candidate division KSB1 bacterium]MDZ7308196.1 S1 family peptidase [candidate division KSB1 bacterium]